MPWKECNAMDERLRFVARLLDGEKMAVMCRSLWLIPGRLYVAVQLQFKR